MSQDSFMNNRNRLHRSEHSARNEYNPEPLMVNIPQAAWQNQNFRAVLWTGNRLQMVLMSIPVREEIGAEVHTAVDQMIRVEEGQAAVQVGSDKDHLSDPKRLGRGDAVFVPAGTWHNIINLGSRPLKLSTIYAPPNHPVGTVQHTKADAEAAGY
ncbi:MAG TPA: cupin domain-containing protein [Oscillospiraceae bacterium]|nr:cupin domain-containing protein [Oscillospiraceae bacterium]HXK77085.1 cupin domain-containing protein [Oscillospiraceae bacterium]